MQWWVQCIDSTVDLIGFTVGSLDVVPCAGWTNGKTEGYRPKTLRDFLLSADALFREGSRQIALNTAELDVAIYDNLYAALTEAEGIVAGAMGSPGHPDWFNIS